jgi:acyl carrier protein
MTFDNFKNILAENLGIEKDLIKRDTSLISDLGIDSLSIVNVIIKIEKKYNIKLDIGNLWELNNVGEVFDMISDCMFKDDVS